MMRAVLLSAVLAAPALALDVPYLSGRVMDEGGILDAATVSTLDNDLKTFEAKTGHQMVVLTIPTLQGEALEDFSLRVARTWKLGRAGMNDGVLLLVAREEHKIRVETGRGLEGTLPDTLSARLVDREMVPRFRAGDFSGGVLAGERALTGVLDGTFVAAPPGSHANRYWMLLILGVVEIFGLFPTAFSWTIYLFMTALWSNLATDLWGRDLGWTLFMGHIIGYPLLRAAVARTPWGRRFATTAGAGGRYVGGSRWTSAGGGFWGGSSSGGFSGGGGSFGGGGSSSSW